MSGLILFTVNIEWTTRQRPTQQTVVARTASDAVEIAKALFRLESASECTIDAAEVVNAEPLP